MLVIVLSLRWIRRSKGRSSSRLQLPPRKRVPTIGRSTKSCQGKLRLAECHSLIFFLSATSACLCVSAVGAIPPIFTAETPRTQRLHRELKPLAFRRSHRALLLLPPAPAAYCLSRSQNRCWAMAAMNAVVTLLICPARLVITPPSTCSSLISVSVNP